ncbi:cytochrome b/b6 domain-containing protein [soil metagenome]
MTATARSAAAPPRHARFVRVTHWLTTIAVLALLVSGVELILSHPRFYWGEVGNVNMAALFSIHVPSSRSTVPTGYSVVLPDQNGWSRSLHFQSAWLVLATGVIYLIVGFRTGHLRRNLVPAPTDRSWRALRASIAEHVRFTAATLGDPWSYNALQRISYLGIIFVLFPLVIWTGLAMAPAFTAVFPQAVDILGGRQSARTLHFFATIALVLFTIVHVTMIVLAGFRSRVGAMITGAAEERT